MLLLLSPAKALDYESATPSVTATEPLFQPQAAKLMTLLKRQSVNDVAGLMDLSPALAQLNVQRYRAWRNKPLASATRAAVFAFDGDVYGGLAAKTLSASQLAWAQQHIGILSGLYGVLRPFDRIQPYRLEMGTRLGGAHGNSLYDFWSDTIAKHLAERLTQQRQPVLVNLASQEYFKAVQRKALTAAAPQALVLECVFEQWHGGRYKVISFLAKRARGLMARYAAQHKLSRPADLQKFDLEGYAFVSTASTQDRWVFRRHPS